MAHESWRRAQHIMWLAEHAARAAVHTPEFPELVAAYGRAEAGERAAWREAELAVLTSFAVRNAGRKYKVAYTETAAAEAAVYTATAGMPRKLALKQYVIALYAEWAALAVLERASPLDDGNIPL